MRMKMIKHIKAGLVIGLLGLVAYLSATAAENKNNIEEARPFTSNPLDLELIDKDGNVVNLKDYRGKKVVLNFWASWCAPCVHEMPTIQEYYNSVDDSEVQVLLVSLDRNFDRAIDFMKGRKYTMPYFKPAGQIPAAMNVSAIPVTFIIDSNGQIANTFTGMADFNSNYFKKSVEEVE